MQDGKVAKVSNEMDAHAIATWRTIAARCGLVPSLRYVGTVPANAEVIGPTQSDTEDLGRAKSSGWP
ncbi:uncharacterized protein ColSpa_10456 [Colletotrichum spaethianum]|uniref:Uncharacterized protein n=1 Tax=Colletotrichum spaethianum TaxID=700344 RepID=A0AA37PDS7_9PEZI|nr:uncharacterized protein ColSpa_10456 [Colletotrichum spaethianum]GKT50275.1 hypothetical protein ColSpa_10456 [Colletotrichum spaethianum]